MNYSRKIIGLISLFVFAVGLIQCSKSDSSVQEQDKRTKEELLLEPITATQIDSVVNQYRGEKAVLINVWATWCGPCVEEFPHIVDLQQKHSEELKVIFISGDFTEPYTAVPAFLKKQGVDWKTYLKSGNDQQFIPALDTTWSGALPFTKIYDKEGQLVARWENSADYETFHKYVKQAIQ